MVGAEHGVKARTRAIPERLKGVFTTRRYKSTFTLPYLYLVNALIREVWLWGQSWTRVIAP